MTTTPAGACSRTTSPTANPHSTTRWRGTSSRCASTPLLADDALAVIGIPSARAMAPSLHLNLGDGYLRQGRVDEAGEQLDAGLAAVDGLGDDGYGAMVRGGLDRLAERLASVTGG